MTGLKASQFFLVMSILVFGMGGVQADESSIQTGQKFSSQPLQGWFLSSSSSSSSERSFAPFSRATLTGSFGSTKWLGHPLKITPSWAQIRAGQELWLELPRAGWISARVESADLKDQLMTIALQVESDPFAQGHLIFNQQTEELSGTLMMGGEDYFIHHQNGRSFLIEQSDLQYEGPRPELPRVSTLMKSEVHATSLVTTTTTDQFVDVMILYTDDVAAYSGAEETLRARVDSTNAMLAASCANFRYRLVYIGPITYTETGNTSTDLSQLAGTSDGQIDSIHTLRDTYGADLVQLVTNSGSICGLAYVSQKDYYNDAYGFSVSGYWCSAKTMAHEWGHNLGSEHDRYERGVGLREETVSLTGYGYVDLLNKYLDIMAYPDQCNDLGVSCTSINLFSNPHIVHGGVPFGVDHFSDSVQRMNEAFPYIANFRSSVSAYTPDIPSSCVSKSKDKDIHCFIATAAYGSYLQPQVKFLREFRDRVLKPTTVGRDLIQTYYRYSPSIAFQIEQRPRLRLVVRGALFLLVMCLKYWAWMVMVALLCLVGTLLHSKNRRKSRWLKKIGSMIFFCGFFWGSSFPEAWGQTSTPSRFYADRVVNPSVRLLLKPSPWLGLSYNQIHQQKQSGSTYKEEIESQDSSLQVGNLAGTFFYELHFTPEYSQNSQLAESGFAEIKSHWDIQQYEALAGLYLFGWPFGIRFSQKNIRLRELDLKEIHQNLTMGFSGLWGENFRWGLGADLASESGDEKATSRWIEPFVGISMGSFGGDSPLFLELSVQRRPQILNVDGTKVNAHGEKMSTQASFEWTSKTGIWPLEPLLFRLSYITEQEKEMDVYVLEEEKNTITKVELGSSILVPGLYWTLNYSTRTSSSSFKDQGVEVGASLFWVGNDIF